MQEAARKKSLDPGERVTLQAIIQAGAPGAMAKDVRLHVYVTIAGQRTRARVSTVGTAGLVARAFGQDLTVPWKDLSDMALLRLARACATEEQARETVDPLKAKLR